MTNPLDSDAQDYRAQRRALTDQLLDTLIRALDLDRTPEQIGLDSPLFGSGLGLDSVDAVAIAAAVESEFEDIRIADTDIPTFRSVNSIVDFIMHRRQLLPLGLPTLQFETPDPLDPDSAAAAPRAQESALKRDYRAIRESVGLLAYAGHAIIEIGGPDHEAFLETVVSGNLSDLAVFGMLQSLILSEGGSIEALVWIARNEGGYWVFAAESSSEAVKAALAAAQGDFDVTVQDISTQKCILSIVGPRAQDFMVGFFNEDLLRLGFNEFTAFPWDAHELIVSRYGETGEFDYRIIAPAHLQAEIGEALRAAGAADGLAVCGPDVLETLCLEMKSITQDIVRLGRFYPSELDLQGMVWTGKPTFRGKEAAVASLKGFEQRAIVLVGEAATAPGAAVYLDGQSVGVILAAAYSIRLGEHVSLAAVNRDYAWPNLRFTVGEEGLGAPQISRSAPLFLPKSVLASMSY